MCPPQPGSVPRSWQARLGALAYQLGVLTQEAAIERIAAEPGATLRIKPDAALVHLFDEELRRYYKLEELWKEGKVLLRVQ